MDPIIIRKDVETGEFVAIYGEFEGRGEFLSDALYDIADQLVREDQ